MRVFVCHASEDKPRVRQLVSRLRKDEFDPWLDEERLLPGQDWELEISSAVRQSDAVIVCLSKASVEKTGYVQKELRHVLDTAEYQPEGRMFVIPVRLEPCRVPEHLSHWQYADLFLENGYERLRDALIARAGVPGPTRPERDLRPQEERPATKGRRRHALRRATAAAIAIAAAATLVWWYLREHQTSTAVHRGDLQLFTTPGAEVRVNGQALGIAARGASMETTLCTIREECRCLRGGRIYRFEGCPIRPNGTFTRMIRGLKATARARSN